MDLDGDGAIDILSGCYSRHDQDMAGLFWLLRGTGDGGFAKAVELKDADGKPLVLTPRGAGDRNDTVIEKICTRPFAADLDGDGLLDLVVGNFAGDFACFRGTGKGTFAATNTWLEHDGKPLHVEHHGDPFLIDWDGDGDLDLLSGSNSGGAFLFQNEGSKTAPKWSARQTLLAPAEQRMMLGGDGDTGLQFGDAHIQGPQTATRVWAADVDGDGDGKLDLLLGDSATITTPAEGLDEATARERHAAWQKKLQQVTSAARTDDGKLTDEQQKAFDALWAEEDKILHRRMTGFVWLLRQK